MLAQVRDTYDFGILKRPLGRPAKKPSENSPIKRASRRRCERKQTPQNRVIATKRRSWEKTVEDASFPYKQGLCWNYGRRRLVT